jgi:hypothetical protein
LRGSEITLEKYSSSFSSCGVIYSTVCLAGVKSQRIADQQQEIVLSRVPFQWHCSAAVHRPQLSNCFMARQPAVLPWRDRNTEVKTDMKGEMDGDVIRIIFIRISGYCFIL